MIDLSKSRVTLTIELHEKIFVSTNCSKTPTHSVFELQRCVKQHIGRLISTDNVGNPAKINDLHKHYLNTALQLFK